MYREWKRTGNWIQYGVIRGTMKAPGNPTAGLLIRGLLVMQRKIRVYVPTRLYLLLLQYNMQLAVQVLLPKVANLRVML
jgi:hypothetical protein